MDLLGSHASNRVRFSIGPVGCYKQLTGLHYFLRGLESAPRLVEDLSCIAFSTEAITKSFNVMPFIAA
jgi:hypothetical protein